MRTLKGPYVVPISQVTPTQDCGSLRVAQRTLEKQGQIEPIVVDSEYLIQYRGEDPYDNDFWHAARALGWSTILVAVEMTTEEIEEKRQLDKEDWI